MKNGYCRRHIDRLEEHEPSFLERARLGFISAARLFGLSLPGIAVHWEAAAPREPHSRCATQWEEIRAYHIRIGYSNIAYSFGVCQHGVVFVGRGWDVQSAATCNSYYNARYWSVCWMGGPGHVPTMAAKIGMRSVIDQARARGARDVIGHQQACATQCPGPDNMVWIRAGLPVDGVVPPPTPPPVPVPEEEEMPGVVVVQRGHAEWWFCRNGVRTHVAHAQTANILLITKQSGNGAGNVLVDDTGDFIAQFSWQGRSQMAPAGVSEDRDDAMPGPTRGIQEAQEFHRTHLTALEVEELRLLLDR